MNKYFFFIFSAIVTVQCQMYTMPYPRPCPCCLPPAGPPCANPTPIFATAAYEIPGTISIPAAAPKMVFGPPPYEMPRPIPAAMAFGPPPCEIPRPIPAPVPRIPVPTPVYEVAAPVQAVVPNMPMIPAPYELALPISMPNPACGCSEIARPVAELPGLPVSNPFLPAASPVSALAPFSPLLPPISTCSRCQYLKKIPIPPPCI